MDPAGRTSSRSRVGTSDLMKKGAFDRPFGKLRAGSGYGLRHAHGGRLRDRFFWKAWSWQDPRGSFLIEGTRYMGFWVYILRCADDSYYTGHTDNLERRLAEHEAGEGGRYTARRGAVTLGFAQECASRPEALALERQIKGWSRRKKEAMTREDWAEVSRLSKGRGSSRWREEDPSTDSA